MLTSLLKVGNTFIKGILEALRVIYTFLIFNYSISFQNVRIRKHFNFLSNIKAFVSKINCIKFTKKVLR